MLPMSGLFTPKVQTKILRNAKEDAAMDDSIREYRSLLIAQHPDLRDTLDIISDDELQMQMQSLFRLAQSLGKANSNISKDKAMLISEAALQLQPQTLH